MRWVLFAGLTCLSLSAPAILPPLGGAVHDNDYDAEWHSTAASDSSGWSVDYLLQNQRNSHLRVVWRDGSGNTIYNGWLAQTAQPVAVCTLQLGTAAPDRWNSFVEIGKLVPKPTDLYEPPTIAARRISTKSVLGIQLGETAVQLLLETFSEYSGDAVSYGLNAQRVEALSQLRFAWQAADSSSFRTTLSKQAGGPVIRLDEKPFRLQIQTEGEPQIRNGSLIALDARGGFVGAVLAPALVP
jgi:hypothetical protein